MLKDVARIVAAYMRKTPVSAEDVPALMSAVHSALTAATNPPALAVPEPVPATTIRKSVRPDAVVCLICGQEGATLRRHLRTAHGLEPDEYRKRFGLPANHPLTAPDYQERRSQIAKEKGLGRKRPKADTPTASEPEPEPEAKAPKVGFRYPTSR